MLWRLWLLVWSEQGTMSPIELLWTAKNYLTGIWYKSGPLDVDKKIQEAIYVELELGGNDFKSCFVQIFTKHSTELLTEYQFCFFSYKPPTGSSFVRIFQKKKKICCFNSHFFVISLNLAWPTVHYRSFHFGRRKKLIHPRPKDTPESFDQRQIFSKYFFSNFLSETIYLQLERQFWDLRSFRSEWQNKKT